MGQEFEITISCEACVRRSTPECAECLVSFVLDEAPEELTLTEADARVFDLFSAEGLVPTLKYRARESTGR
ncbi:MAG TPA: hypothetical protein PLS29_06930 [Acidimicrobiales bacterium]|nr:MAG: hypothetical protein B7Z69_07770 [Actinobacteria bacterium 21-73-9]HQU26751.1 hypothetical protein [Acidimicrobiales bacterium]